MSEYAAPILEFSDESHVHAQANACKIDGRMDDIAEEWHGLPFFYWTEHDDGFRSLNRDCRAGACSIHLGTTVKRRTGTHVFSRLSARK
jgi:hypothetical protein